MKLILFNMEGSIFNAQMMEQIGDTGQRRIVGMTFELFVDKGFGNPDAHLREPIVQCFFGGTVHTMNCTLKLGNEYSPPNPI